MFYIGAGFVVHIVIFRFVSFGILLSGIRASMFNLIVSVLFQYSVDSSTVETNSSVEEVLSDDVCFEYVRGRS
jgi:hypothetical protein